jgi:hypothetical protein
MTIQFGLKDFFRIFVRIFNYLCTTIHDDIVGNRPHAFKVGIHGRKLEVEKQVEISLKRLAIGVSVLTIAELFGVSIAIVSKMVRRFKNAMIMRASHFNKWPTNEDLNLVKIKFERIRGIPQVCGTIDYIHG